MQLDAIFSEQMHTLGKLRLDQYHQLEIGTHHQNLYQCYPHLANTFPHMWDMIRLQLERLIEPLADLAASLSKLNRSHVHCLADEALSRGKRPKDQVGQGHLS